MSIQASGDCRPLTYINTALGHMKSHGIIIKFHAEGNLTVWEEDGVKSLFVYKYCGTEFICVHVFEHVKFIFHLRKLGLAIHEWLIRLFLVAVVGGLEGASFLTSVKVLTWLLLKLGRKASQACL